MTQPNPPPARPRSRPTGATGPAQSSGSPSNPTSSIDNRETEAGGATERDDNLDDAYPFAMTPLPGEDPREAALIAEYLISEIKPRAGIERLMTQSIIDHTREIRILEKVRSRLAAAGFTKKLQATLEKFATMAEQISPVWNSKQLAQMWSAGNADARQEVSRRLQRVGITIESLTGQAFPDSLDDMERVSDLIGKAEQRRDKLIRTLQDNRAIVASLALRELQGRRLELQIEDARARQADPTGSDVEHEHR